MRKRLHPIFCISANEDIEHGRKDESELFAQGEALVCIASFLDGAAEGSESCLKLFNL